MTGAIVKDERAFERLSQQSREKIPSDFEERFAALRVVGYFAVFRRVSQPDGLQPHAGRGFGAAEREWLLRANLAGSILLTIILWVVGGYLMGGLR